MSTVVLNLDVKICFAQNWIHNKIQKLKKIKYNTFLPKKPQKVTFFARFWPITRSNLFDAHPHVYIQRYPYVCPISCKSFKKINGCWLWLRVDRGHITKNFFQILCIYTSFYSKFLAEKRGNLIFSEINYFDS